MLAKKMQQLLGISLDGLINAVNFEEGFKTWVVTSLCTIEAPMLLAFMAIAVPFSRLILEKGTKGCLEKMVIGLKNLKIMAPLEKDLAGLVHLIISISNLFIFRYFLIEYRLHYHLYKLGYELGTFEDISVLAFLICLEFPLVCYAIVFSIFLLISFQFTSKEYKKTVCMIVALCFVCRAVFYIYLAYCGSLSLAVECGAETLTRILKIDENQLWADVLLSGLCLSIVIESFLIQLTTSMLHSECPLAYGYDEDDALLLEFHLRCIRVFQSIYISYISFVITIIFDCKLNRMAYPYFIDEPFILKYLACIWIMHYFCFVINYTLTIYQQVVIVTLLTLGLLPIIGSQEIVVSIYEDIVQNGESSVILEKIRLYSRYWS